MKRNLCLTLYRTAFEQGNRHCTSTPQIPMRDRGLSQQQSFAYMPWCTYHQLQISISKRNYAEQAFRLEVEPAIIDKTYQLKE